MASENIDRIRAQFTRQADAYARMEQTRDQRSLDALVGLSGAQPEHRVLDVACGPGFLTLTFATRCAEAVGFDATETWLPRARAEAARRGLTNVRFELGDATALPFPDARFDVVACRAAFHHFPEPASVLAEMRRVVVMGGCALIADMLGSDDATKAQRHDEIERLCDPSHVRALPAAEFRRLFASAALDVAREIPGTMAYDVEEWMAHGGPADADARRIVALLEASIDGDRTGLAVERVEGRLRFRHRVAVWVLRRTD